MVKNFMQLRTDEGEPYIMIVNEGLVTKFPFPETDDHELFIVLKNINRVGFNLKDYKKVLELGSNGSFFSNMLTQNGHSVVGIDVNDYHCYPDGMDREEPECNFLFIKGNASDIEFKEHFDLMVSISAVEHFGCSFYGEGADIDGDSKAMVNTYNSLKKGGLAIITVPITDKEYYFIDQGYIRRYNQRSLIQRLVGEFKVEYFELVPRLVTMVSSATCMLAPSGPNPVIGRSIDDLYRADFSHTVQDYDSSCIYLELRKE